LLPLSSPSSSSFFFCNVPCPLSPLSYSNLSSLLRLFSSILPPVPAFLLSLSLSLVYSFSPLAVIVRSQKTFVNWTQYDCNYFTNICTIISLLYTPRLHVSTYSVIIRAYKIYQSF
jgi:hypothetical protein